MFLFLIPLFVFLLEDKAYKKPLMKLCLVLKPSHQIYEQMPNYNNNLVLML